VGTNAANGAPPSTPGPAQAVVVTNDATQPVPVAPQGTTTVAVSGTPTVKLDTAGNTVKSGDKTVEVHDGATTEIEGERRTSGKIAVSDYATIRIAADVLCREARGAHIDVYTTYAHGQQVLDTIGTPGAVAQLVKTYDVPGTEIEVIMGCGSIIDDGTAVVWGRP
jgi:hypothetical protein